MGRKPQEMDSGWAWILVAGFGVSSFLLGGFIKAFGVFFATFASTFDASASLTSVIVGTRAIMFTIVGPLSAILSERYSERLVLIGSGLFCSLGALVAAFAPNIEMVVFSSGILMGIGISTYFGPLQIAIGKYFNKRKTIAVSLSLLGLCLAQIVMAPVNIIFLEAYALQGTLMIYAGLLLNIVVAGALVRPVKAYNRGYAEEKAELPEKGKALSILELASVQGLNSSRELIKTRGQTSPKIEFSSNGGDPEEVVPMASAGEEVGRSEVNGFEAQNTEEYIENTQNSSSGCVKIMRSMKHVLDFSLFKNRRFAMYALADSLSIVAFDNVPVYLFPRAKDYGLTANESALLITIIGCTELLSRILQGVFGDLKGARPRVLFTGGIFCFGVSAAAVPFTKTFLEMAIVSGFLGLFGSTTVVLHMPILVETVGLPRLPKAVALSSFFCGIANAVAPPLLGYIKDVTASYNYVYVACAGILFLATALMIAEPIIRWVARRNKEN